MNSASIIGIVNQKGGTGKTTTCVNLGIDLVHEGKRVLIADCDPQGSLTISLGYPQPDSLPVTLADLMGNVLSAIPIHPGDGVLHHEEGVRWENRRSGQCRGNLLRAAADRIVIPVQAQYLSAKGVEQLLGTVARVKRNINHKLKIDGVLLTMVDSRTNNSKEIASLLRSTYGPKIKVFDTEIPRSVRAAEISAEGKSIFEHDPGGKVAAAYHALTKEVLHLEEQRQKHKSDLLR